jgi:hypothetical protein
VLGWSAVEVERRAAGWSAMLLGGGCATAGWRATDWSEEVEADPTVEMEVDLAVRR